MSLRLLERAFELLGAADVAALGELYTDDYVLELPYAKPEAVRVEGLALVQPYLRRAFESLRFTLTITEAHALAGEDALVAEYTSEGRLLASGERYANTYIGIWRFRDGKVCATREYYDPTLSASSRSV